MTTPWIVVALMGALLVAGCVLALVRVVRGPSILDRLIATDVLLAAMMTGFASLIVFLGRVDLMPLILAIAMLGTVASISVARYASGAGRDTPPALDSSSSSGADEDDDVVLRGLDEPRGGGERR
ncbi:monovalent cation/H+ antiporter complex subunit F [Sediminivirga luteola]|uniref:monovalent cation/H+ antiporter complex subunit F n=1 Tax=Sediminivirga luteola TaxID=1774748 RepID=UPI001F573AD6|nr:monovalent cation/H+ antiporter complex subunit F [Sediminivirga luteola]MCI2264454.1 monovalent cation/H+ antiporter complex subunit F [Sediminivirga luteola]